MASAPETRIRWSAALITLVGVGLLVWFGLSRLQFEADILQAMPGDDPVLDGASYVLEHHPGLERVAVDLRMADGSSDRDALVDAANRLSLALEESGLFRRVGNSHYTAGMTRLLSDAAAGLPTLFTSDELDAALADRLSPEALDRMVAETIATLSGLQGIGQAGLMLSDPFELRGQVLARAAGLLPAVDAQLHRGHLITTDGRHLLLVAEPAGAGTNTVFAARLDAVMAAALAAMDEAAIIATPVGAYRAALDNERAARGDTQQALLLASIFIVLLLLLFFPRPWLGVLALIPAVAGTAAGLALFSLFETRIWLLALGFGGAIVSITVDHGVAYLLLLDRREGASGKAASREVWSVGLLATLTTVGAFLSLRWSGFPVLEQLGLFAALGVACSFLFVHTIFPWIFKSVGPVRRQRRFDAHHLTAALVRGRGWPRLAAAGLIAAGLGFFARPDFHADLSAMNSVSAETLAAESLVQETWGDVLGQVSILVEGDDPEELMARTDRLAGLLDAGLRDGSLDACFSPSFLYPGPDRAAGNRDAWIRFWSPVRREAMTRDLARACTRGGLTADAFAPFLALVEPPPLEPHWPAQALHPMLGITETEDGRLLAVASARPGPAYDPAGFVAQAADIPGVQVMDPGLFSQRLSEVLFTTFGQMLAVIGGGVLVLLVLFFLGWVLPLLVLLPLVFSLVCTLGTLHLLGRPLDIPALLLGVVVVGMGIDYAVFFVRSYQRHRDDGEASYLPIWSAVLLACLSTLAGFGTLALSEHALLSGAGLTGALAIGYAGLGTFLMLPPLLKRVFRERAWTGRAHPPGSREHRAATLSRYRHMEPYPRQFARFKQRLDPMFPRLADWVRPGDRVLDVGCGYGVPGTWILALYPDTEVFGLDPDPERVRVADRAWGSRGTAVIGRAPHLPAEPTHLDLALMLDMAHHLTDDELSATLSDLHARLSPGGRLVIRVTIPTNKTFRWERGMERLRFRLLGIGRPRFRTVEQHRDLLTAAGFRLDKAEATAAAREETWLIASAGASPA